jgi:hypothetical protein
VEDPGTTRKVRGRRHNRAGPGRLHQRAIGTLTIGPVTVVESAFRATTPTAAFSILEQHSTTTTNHPTSSSYPMGMHCFHSSVVCLPTAVTEGRSESRGMAHWRTQSKLFTTLCHFNAFSSDSQRHKPSQKHKTISAVLRLLSEPASVLMCLRHDAKRHGMPTAGVLVC